MDNSNPEYLTAEELRNRLYHSLRNRGLVDAVKSQLRNSLVTELQQSLSGQLTVRDLQGPPEGSLLYRAANCLVAGHLRHCKYDYTLSTFLSESGLSQDKLFNAEDLLQLLNINKHSRLFHKLTKQLETKNGKGFLWQFLHEMADLHANATHEFGVQTDLIRVGPLTSLDDKLHSLEELYHSKREEAVRHGSVAVEERLLTYQRQLEDRYNSELKRELARMKDNEIARIRLEEREKGRKELDQMRRELERTYQSKYDALVERERHSLERLQKEQEIQEKEVYAQRQTLLEEIEAVHHREADVWREAEVNLREKKLNEERIKALGEELHRRLLEVKRKEAEVEQRVQNEMIQFKLDYQARFIERTQNVEVREAKVKEAERQVAEEKQTIQSVKDELRDRKHRVNELETFLQEAKYSEVNATKHNEFVNAKLREMSDYKTIKEQNVLLRNELETVRTRLSEVLNMNERERGRQEELLRELRRPNPETLLMQRDLEKTRESLRQEQLLFDQQKQLLENRLKDEVDRNKELLRRFEEQTLQMREMNREIIDLRQHLNLTQKALSNEVYRKPHGPEDSSPPASPASFLGSKPQRGTSYVNVSTPSAPPYPQRCFGNDDVYNDVDIFLDLPPAGAARVGQFSEEDVSSIGSADVVAEAKYRLKSLEKEAQNLERAYHEFHIQMTNVHSVPAITDPPATRSQHHSQRGRPGQSPNQSPILRPLSSTPYRQQPSGNIADDSFHEFSKKSAKENKPPEPPPQFNLSALSDDMDGRHREGAGEERRVKSRPITLSDLEARPGSPSVVVVAGSGSSGEPSLANHDKPGRSSFLPAKPTPLIPVGATGITQGASQQTPIISLEEAWKAQKELGDKASPEDQRREQETDRERDQEQFHKRMPQEEDHAREADAVTTTATKVPEDVIDPIMQQYMAMVQKEKEKAISRKTNGGQDRGLSEQSGTHSGQDSSVSEEIKSLTASGDESGW